MAGHSKWANIKHRKGRQDAKRSKVWSKCSRAIIVAAKNGGGDPDANLALRYAIDEAKAENMPKDTIEKAIAKGSGADSDAASFEQIIYEGYGPGGVALLVDVLTDNRNRTASEIRNTFDKRSGNLGASGCVAYIFQNKGEILIEGGDEETVMDAALEAGAQDVVEEGEGFIVTTEPTDFIAVREALEKAGLTIASAQLTMIPDTTVPVTGSDARKTLGLIELLEDCDDVQKVYANYEIDDKELAAIEADS